MPYCEYPSPVGILTLVASDAGLQGVWWPDDARSTEVGKFSPTIRSLLRQLPKLDEYFAGRRTTFDVPLDPSGTDFQRSAWDVLRTIPYAQTMTYAQQAAQLGDPAKARAVGAANGRNPISIIVPCHRVVGASGALTGFAGGLDAKQWLLQFELDTASTSGHHTTSVS
ncbi:MAG: methylated-DNA--[protein]-cysteine S-methyltransferase [Micrococcales bacterium]|nr:methylated-DNA--[protein]-cysteine S-methyltransferase [Micrococcales bacterium]